MTLSEIWIYPLKSFGGVALDEWEVLASGPLEKDREFALFDEKGKVYNGKRDTLFSGLDLQWDQEGLAITAMGLEQLTLKDLASPAEQRLFSEWASDYFGKKLELRSNQVEGFPDDLEANGPTWVHRSSLQRVANWFDLSESECLRRFRVNLILDSEDSAFAEDLWVGQRGQLGECQVEFTNICRRCVVPTRDSTSGLLTLDFVSRFNEFRVKERPQGVNPAVYNVDYKFCLNSKTLRGGLVRVGQPFSLLSL